MPKRPEATEKPTPKRRSEARSKGQVAKSPDLSSAAIFLAGVFFIYFTVHSAIGRLGQTMQGAFSHIYQHQELTIFSVWRLFVQALAGAGFLLFFLFIFALVIGVLINILQVGFLFTFRTITPKFSKINPISGFQRFVQPQMLVNLAKQFIKLGAVFAICAMSIIPNVPMFVTLASTSPANVLFFTSNLLYGIGWKFGLLLVIVGILDYAYNRHQNEQSLMMTKTEIKDEMRQSEGSPEAKSAVKRRQREFSRRRMMAAVPRATVVVTNPTHYAVALEWDEIKMDAPVVTAKGADLVAKRIREIAKEHNVPIMENPPLARTLYTQVELDQAIPPNLYAAVAQVIAFVFKLKRRSIA